MAGLESIVDIAIFARIVSAGSLSAAARDLDFSLAAVSKRLIRLERALGTRLINRTTRQLSLTTEGQIFHVHCLTVLEDVRLAEEAIAGQRDGISGLLRVTASNAFARRQIAPRLGRFLDQHPNVRIDLIASDDVLDIVKDGIDIAVRQADLPNSELVSRAIASDRRLLCAAPIYLDRYGAPCRPEDLMAHRYIVFGDPPITTLHLSRDEEVKAIEIDWAVHINAGDVAHAAVLGGAGIIAKSVWEVAEDIKVGRLVEVLPGWKAPARPIHIVYPSVRYKTLRIAAFVDFLSAEFRFAERELGI